MTLIDYLKTIPGLDNHIVIDQFETWGSSIFDLVDSSKNELKKYLEERQKIEKIRNRTNRPINIYEEKWNSVVSKVNSYLSNKKIIGFHCARLMDCEIDDILNNGLTPLTYDFAYRKINLAHNLGLIPLDLKEELIHKDEYNEESNRPNKVHLTHNSNTAPRDGVL